MENPLNLIKEEDPFNLVNEEEIDIKKIVDETKEKRDAETAAAEWAKEFN